ncbi:hypothetical protein N7475_008388 [Penicillium sp. IBT 31633x]|nr:hypothetical protein N7475_008388 [Penicillium sp. IBT 31633x]
MILSGQNFNSLILSLYTFFEDFKYLEAYTYYIKRLYENHKFNIHSTLRRGNRDFRGSGFPYLDLRLYVIRHYTLMPPDPKSDNELLAKLTRAKPDKRAIYEIAKLAY